MAKRKVGMKRRFYSFNEYLKEKFGVRVHRISLDAGFGCPNLDGTLSSEGCIFCNNKAFSHFAKSKPVSLEEQIKQSIKYTRKRFGAKKFIAYFQSFSNTYGELEFLKKQYAVIRKFSNIVGIAISTRPDCIDDSKLDLIEKFAKDYAVYIEYGLQTAKDDTLKLLNRNHTFFDFKRAVELTARRDNINIGVHVILGLPKETKADILSTALILSTMPLWGVKFHCLHAVKQTSLEDRYNKGKVKLSSEDEYIDNLVSFLELVPDDWVVLRLVSDADRKLLVGPAWINGKQRILKRIEEEFKKRKTYQGILHESSCGAGA